LELKEDILDDMERRIYHLYYKEDHTTEKIEMIKKYLELEEKIQSERLFGWDITTVARFCTAVGTPLLVFLSQLPQTLAIPSNMHMMFNAIYRFIVQ